MGREAGSVVRFPGIPWELPLACVAQEGTNSVENLLNQELWVPPSPAGHPEALGPARVCSPITPLAEEFLSSSTGEEISTAGNNEGF